MSTERKNKASIYSDFIMLSSVFLLCVFLMFSITSYFSYQGILKYEKKSSYRLSKNISNYVSDSIDRASYAMKFRARKIQQNNSDDLDKINNILNEKEIVQDNILVLNFFEWVNKKDHQSISSIIGKMNPPLDFSSRDYLPLVKKTPWKVHLGRSIEGGLSQRNVIPLALGITGVTGKYLGCLISSIDVVRFNSTLHYIFDKDPSIFFFVLTKGGELLFYSRRTDISDKDLDYKELSKKIQNHLKTSGSLNIELPKNVELTFYKKLPSYPLYVVVGVDKKEVFAQFSSALFPHFLVLILISIIFIVILIYYRRKIINPVMSLASSVEAISNGRDVTIPNSDIYEISVLAEQIRNVRNFNITLKSKIKEQTMSLENSLSFNREMVARIGTKVAAPFQSIKRVSIELTSNWKNLSENKRCKYASIILDSSKLLTKNMSNILSLSKIEKGELDLNIEKDVDILSLINSVINELNPHDQEYIEISVNNLINPKICCDKIRVSEVMRNIIDNAINHTYENKINVNICSEGKDYIRIEVIDRGPGIPPGEEKRIFDKFVFNNKKGPGDDLVGGVGLVLSKSIIVAHGGNISCANILENNEIVGAKFFFTLPYVIENKDQDNNMKVIFESKSGFFNLSKREIQCITFMQSGKTMKEIALHLGVSPRTVEHHINNIKKKTNLKYKSQLMSLGKEES